MLVNVELRGRGASPDALRGALEGHMRLLMGAGKAKVGAPDRLIGGLTAAVGQVFTKDSQLIVVNCSATDIAFGSGQAKVDLGLMDTAYSPVLLEGTADLVKGTLDLEVTPRQQTSVAQRGPHAPHKRGRG
jgi:uncharacterized protein involved in outer membrane biogenesis